jgi:hypothetical protein
MSQKLKIESKVQLSFGVGILMPNQVNLASAFTIQI